MSAKRLAISFAFLLAAGPVRAQTEPLTLERAITLALERNERAQVANERLRAAQAQLVRARAFFLPDLTLSGTYTRNLYEVARDLEGGGRIVTRPYNVFDANASLRMTLLDARGFPLYAAASHGEKAARAETTEARRQLAFETGEAFLGALSADQVLSAAERRLEFARQSLHDAEARFAAQLVSSNDVTQAKLELATANRELVRAEGNRESAYVALSFLINEASAPGQLTPPDELIAQAEAARPRDEDVAQAKDVRLDIVAARERAAAAKSLALEPWMRFLPSLGLSANYGLTSNTSGLNTRADNGSAALELVWNLFDGGERYADRRERLAEANIATLTAQALERGLSAEVRTAAVALASAKAALEAAKVAYEAAEQNAKERSILYQQGLSSALEQANANVLRFDAQVALTRERFALTLALFDLRAALGQDPLGREMSR